ncbi:hypothetical protein BU15DRAFT_61537 [Melanogaster broomeanus]|nr:hypothetical protein BU15DRAFT_61537 [Melanogaster broomeanus]
MSSMRLRSSSSRPPSLAPIEERAGGSDSDDGDYGSAQSSNDEFNPDAARADDILALTNTTPKKRKRLDLLSRRVRNNCLANWSAHGESDTKQLNVDTRYNLMCLTADWHTLFDRSEWVLTAFKLETADEVLLSSIRRALHRILNFDVHAWDAHQKCTNDMRSKYDDPDSDLAPWC